VTDVYCGIGRRAQVGCLCCLKCWRCEQWICRSAQHNKNAQEQVQVLYFTQKCTKCFKNQNKRLDTRLGDIARDSKVKQYITMPMECRKFTKMHTKKVNCAAFKCTNILWQQCTSCSLSTSSDCQQIQHLSMASSAICTYVYMCSYAYMVNIPSLVEHDARCSSRITWVLGSGDNLWQTTTTMLYVFLALTLKVCINVDYRKQDADSVKMLRS